jgi:hypothetical protein
MEKLILDSISGNYIVSIAIGKKYLKFWNEYFRTNWITYCKKNKIGLIIITKDLIDKKSIYWKKPNWQKLLIGKFLEERYPKKIQNICYLDTDIYINPFSPNIFDSHDEKKISVVSMFNNLPYDLFETKKKISYLRHNFYSKKYPLDSSLFMNINEIYDYHNLKPQKDYFCAGMFVFNLKKFSKDMYQWFFKYDKNVHSITNGDQTHLNYEFFKKGKIKILPYQFQSLWVFEIVNKFPFLYKKNLRKKELIVECVEKSILENFFLHFAGGWGESDMCKIKKIFSKKKINFYKKYYDYFKVVPFAKPKGIIKPSKFK